MSANHQNIYREFKRLRETTHFGHLYRTRTQRLDAAVPFVQVALERGERCLYLTNGTARETVLEELSVVDSDIDDALASDQLRVVPQAEVDVTKTVDPAGFFSQLHDRLAESEADGFDGLRVVIDVPWGEASESAFEQFLNYRTEVQPEFPAGAVVLSQHDMSALAEEEVLDLTHLYPRLLYRGRICDNPYYDTADGTGPPSLSVEEVLGTAHELATAREAIRQRDQRVAVLNRVLRHNLRNELNVVQTHAELVEDRTDDPEIRESVATIRETTDRLLEIAEDARRVQQLSADDVPDRGPVELDSTLRRAATRARSQYPTIDIDVSVNGAWVEGTDHLDVALTELLKRLAEAASKGCQIRVEEDSACTNPGHHCLRVECDSAQLPETELESLSNGIETQLTHGSGLGLWLVNWIVDLSGGRLDFEDDASALLSLPAADSA